MPKDYAQKYASAQRRPPRNRRVIVLLSLVVILLLGGFITSALYFERNHLQKVVKKQVKTPSHQKTKLTEQAKKSQQPKFDFYSILTDTKTQVPHNIANVIAPPIAIKNSGYVLQVAAVRNYTDAERLKAELALLGFTVFIQKSENQSGSVWNRVNVGPYTSLAAAKTDQARLESHQINSILLTLKTKS